MGLQVTPHFTKKQLLRKRYLMNGGDSATLSRFLGHASLEITSQIYLDFADKEIMQNYRKHSPVRKNIDI